MIEQDIRNNSAWNQRWFVCHRGKSGNHPLSLEEARREADFAIEEGARLDPYNESPWRYLIGVLREQQRAQGKDVFDGLLMEYQVRAEALSSVLITANRDPDTCVNMTSARIDLLEMDGTKDSLNTAIVLVEGLAKEHDVVRTKYWSLVLKRLRNKEKSLNDQ